MVTNTRKIALGTIKPALMGAQTVQRQLNFEDTLSVEEKCQSAMARRSGVNCCSGGRNTLVGELISSLMLHFGTLARNGTLPVSCFLEFCLSLWPYATSNTSPNAAG